MLNEFLLVWNRAADLMWAAVVNAIPASIAVAATAWLFIRLQRNWAAATRYAIWCIVFALIVAFPAIHRLLTNVANTPPAAVAGQAPALKEMPARTSVQPSHEALLSSSFPVLPRANQRDTAQALTVPGALFLIWSVAAVIQFVRLAFMFQSNLRLKHRAAVPPQELQTRWLERLYSLRVRRRVALRLSSEIDTPAVVGYIRPIVLLPSAVIHRLADEELDQIVVHELAHVRRYDDWAIALERLIQAAFGFHPLVHFITHKLDLEREIACDDCVLATQAPKAYASCLTKIAEFCLPRVAPRLMTLAIERRSQLSRRVEMLLDTSRAIAARVSIRNVGACLPALLILAGVGLRLPSLMAYPAALQAPGPPETPAAPQPPPVSGFHPAPQVRVPATPPATPQAPATPAPSLSPESDGIDSIIVYSQDGHSYVYGNFNGGNLTAQANPDKAGSIEVQRNGKWYVIRDPQTVRSAEQIFAAQQELGRSQSELGGQQAKLAQEQAKLAHKQAGLSGTLTGQDLARLQRDLKEQLSQIDTQEIERAIKRAQSRIKQIDTAELQKQIEAARRAAGSFNADQINRMIQHLQQEFGRLTADEAQQAAAEAQSQIGEIQSRLGELESRIGEAQNKTSAELAQQEIKLAEEQSHLGEMQSKLAEQEDRLANEVQKKLNDLINRAFARDLAHPVR